MKGKTLLRQQNQLLPFGRFLKRTLKTSIGLKNKYLSDISREFDIAKDISKKKNIGRAVNLPNQIIGFAIDRNDNDQRTHFQIAGSSTMDV